ncbi:ClC family H(+)/Cl(-) exchange transporter [Enterococcus sp. JM4C]|uniref:ClC family H(+)/Cl(-) exchange transporter n=1 Tax=Candidatus Enterococcus huntleyi TaxID=1857217 RepID=UPI0013795E42|nr:ClC family H(+)/Cl(-) exchange transporter [Enterococcus sp. JM4C]KAF1297385.1 ClC family H(+)/Cl(-) exchange transporter [Enterococcus sp. JM4C]
MDQKKEHEIQKLDGTRILFIGKGIIVGAFVGVVVTLFRFLIEEIGEQVVRGYLFFQKEPIWLIPWVIVSVVLALIVGRLVKSDGNIKGSGIPQVEGQLQGQLTIDWFSVLWKKFLGGVLSISAGLFLGREGPSIQLGAVVAQGVSKQMNSSKAEEKILISSGASAGLSAAFNAPIAGLLFVLEEVYHSFSPLVWLTSFSSAITANFISLYVFGLKPVLYIGAIKALPLKYYWTLPILGILLGVLGRAYQLALLSLPKWYGKLTFLSPNYYGLVPFLLVIPIGILFPHVLGGGNQIVLSLADAPLSLWLLLGLFVLRFVFSMVSYGSNLPGGIFLPILTLGAVIGTFYGVFLTDLLGLEPIFVKNFLMFAMAGYFAAIGKAPLTAIILVTEMVGNFSHLMSIGVVVLVSYVVVEILGGHPIYETLLERLVKPTFKDISGRKTILEFPVHAESSFDEQMVRDIDWPAEMLLTSIRRGESELIPHGETIIHGGDTLIILTDESITQKVRMELWECEKANQK